MAHSSSQAKKATASGWIGSALEYYDFFIYAQAAALIFPQIFFPNTDPKMAIIASLATYGVGYLARPVGGNAGLDRGDAAIGDRDVEEGVDARLRIDDAPAPEQEMESHGDGPGRKDGGRRLWHGGPRPHQRRQAIPC